MSSTTAATQKGLFFTYAGGEFHHADVVNYFGGKARTPDDIVDVILSQGYESMTREDIDAGEIRFSLWEGGTHQCVVRIVTAGVAPHYIYLNGLLNWLQFQGAILAPAFQMAGLVKGDA